jgi:hypothetical protein
MKIRPKKTVIGTATCHCCGRDIPVKQSETGTLDMSCQWCDLPMYAKKGTEAHRRLLERVTLFEAKGEASPTSVADVVKPSNVPHDVKPAARVARGVFDVLAGRAE